MVSNRKRYISESTTDDETGDMEYSPNNQQKSSRKPTRIPKCFTKNALMARENRLKKKMYINSLEEQVARLKADNKNLIQIVDKQTSTIEEMKKEVKYLKSILANSEGISKLIKAINSSTGMAVTTALPEIDSRVVPNITQSQYQSGFDFARHPWEETKPLSPTPYDTFPIPDSADSCYGSPGFKQLEEDGLLLDVDIPIDEDLLGMIDEKTLETPILPEPQHKEHNYHHPKTEPVDMFTDEDEDVGVCLHVSKNKVSLEFCPSCSDNALQSWKSS